MEVHIQGVTSAKAMKLASPDRIVLDVPNSVPTLNSKNILVNSPDLKSVRVARFSADPPVTRIVLDLKAERDYEMISTGTDHADFQVRRPPPASPLPSRPANVSGLIRLRPRRICAAHRADPGLRDADLQGSRQRPPRKRSPRRRIGACETKPAEQWLLKPRSLKPHRW